MNDDMRQGYTAVTAATVAVTAGVTTTESSEMICECHQPGPEKIDVEQVLAAQMRQKVVEFDMMVPDKKPDVRQVIDVYVKEVGLKTIDLIPNKVIIRGDMEVKVMYIAKLPNEPVHAFEKKHVKFTRDIDVEGALPEMKAMADCTVEYVDYDFSDCEPRKVHITIVLKFWARVTTTTQMDIMALSPIDQIGVYENITASASSAIIANASQFTPKQVAAAQLPGNDFASGAPQLNTAAAPPAAAPVPEVTVKEVETTAGAKLSIAGTVGKVTGNRVNVRTGPGTNYPSITMVNKGDTVTIKEQAFGWYKVVLPDGTTTGWLASWFVDLVV